MPPENSFDTSDPSGDAKWLLGQILFWDEQLSSDDSMACGTCHAFRTGGADPRREVLPGPDGLFDTADDIPAHPGPDGIFGNADDMPAVHPGKDLDFSTTADNVRGSQGMRRLDVNLNPVFDPLFGFGPQVTRRTAMNVMGGNIAPEVLWDGRASGAFFEPDDCEGGGTTLLIANGAGLENQAVETLCNPVEMAKQDRTPADVVNKISGSVPWAQNTDFPVYTAAHLAAHPSYADLYQAAFGEPGITLGKTAMALATYIRGLVPDDTPFDNGVFFPGESDLEFTNCSQCHEENNAGPGVNGNNFTDDTFRFLGLQPPPDPSDPNDDQGTGSHDDFSIKGAFKVATLRNAALKLHFFHTGQFTTLEEVVSFYVGPRQHPDVDEELPVTGLTAQEQVDLIEFIRVGLVDPRVANETEIFSSPTLLPEPSGSVGVLAGLLALLVLRRGARQSRAGFTT